MCYNEFTEDIFKQMKNKPSYIRKGQFVFNYIEEKYGDVARMVQFIDHIDCFYDDDKIDAFMEKCYERLEL